MSGKTVRVAGVQVATVDARSEADRAANIESSIALVRSKPGFDVYCLPEMTVLGYGHDLPLQAPGLAEPLDLPDGDPALSPSFAAFSRLAIEMNAHIVYGFARRVSPKETRETENAGDASSAATLTTIAQAIVGPDGRLVDVYDKLHLCSFGDCSEASAFTPGDRLVTFRVRDVLFGVLICFDLRFPEVWRALCLPRDRGGLGCDAILHPSAFPDDGSFDSWHPVVLARALENQVPVISVNRAHPHHGESITAGPWTNNWDSNSSSSSNSNGNDCKSSNANSATTSTTTAHPLQGSPLLTAARVFPGRGEGVLEMVVDPAETEKMRTAFPLRLSFRNDYASMVLERTSSSSSS
jgi:predicted amidohydrolase